MILSHRFSIYIIFVPALIQNASSILLTHLDQAQAALTNVKFSANQSDSNDLENIQVSWLNNIFVASFLSCITCN